MTPLPGDIEMEDGERSLREALLKQLWHYEAMHQTAGHLVMIDGSDLQAACQRKIDSIRAKLSPAQRTSIPNHPEGGK